MCNYIYGYVIIILRSRFYGSNTTMTTVEEWCITNNYFSCIEGIYSHATLPHVSIHNGDIMVHFTFGPRYMTESDALIALKEAKNGMS